MPMPPFAYAAALAVLSLPGPTPCVAPVDFASRAERSVFLVPVSATPDEMDFAFLAAVPAAAHGNAGKPVVLAVDPVDPWRPEVADFLRRYHADRVTWIGAAPPPEGPLADEPATITAGTMVEAACALAREFAPVARRVVVCATTDRCAALAASVLATRLDAPLFPYPGEVVPEAVLAAAKELAAERVLLVGGGDAAFTQLRKGGWTVERLRGPLEVAKRMDRAGLRTDYVVAVDGTDDAAGRVRKLSLAAVLLAAGRDGVLAPLDLDTRWKERFPTLDEPAGTPPIAEAGEGAQRRGTIELDGKATAFVTGTDPGDGHAWLRLDLDGDGAFAGPDEERCATGAVVTLGARRWMVDLDVEETARGASVWLTSPPVDEVTAALAPYREAVGGTPSYLCLVGGPEAIPSAIIGDARGVDCDMVSDLAYGNIDDDPFVDLACSRFPAEDHIAATLLACRTLVYSDLRDGLWDQAFTTVEWEVLIKDVLEEVGLRHAGHHPGTPVLAADTPLSEVAILAHGSHAAWTCLGGFYTSDSTVLTAPCVVESQGCSTASLDQDAAHRSVATRLLRNGAVAFAGNRRRGVGQQELFHSEFWNALLAGQTLGEANRFALNRVMVAVLEKGELTGGLFRYQLHNAAVYGDPAWRLPLPSGPPASAARTEVRGRRVLVHAPTHWWRTNVEANAEWGYTGPGAIHHWRGAGMGVECWWHGGERRNANDLLYTAEVRTRRNYTGVDPVGEVPAPLGRSGPSFVDEHPDGTRSLYWRVRFLDADMRTGEERAKIDRLEFRLRTK